MTLAVLLLSCLAVPAWSQEAPSPEGPSVDLAEEADLHFRIGIDHYRNGRFEDALEHLLLSNRLVPNRNVVFNVARGYEQLGRFDEAYRHYFEYVSHETDPSRRANGERAIDRIRDKIALVRVTSDPPGASLFVDRKNLGARGRTPMSLALAPGEHTILLELDGHDPAQQTVEMAIGGEASVELELEPILGTLKVEGTPSGATIRIGEEDGPVVGTLPGELLLSPGPHVLVVSAEGYQTTRQIAQVQPRATSQTVVELPLVTGTLVVDAHERDSLVEIDGRAAGFTPAVLDVAVGEHELRVTRRGYHPYVTQVTITEDDTTTADVQLRSLREVVAASRTAQSVEDAPASVTLITAEEIRAFGYQNPYQALGGVRGVYQTNDLTYQYLGFRGFSTPGDYGNRVLVTVDGHTMNDDQIGASYVGSDFAVDLGDVRQIEVVRGPGSSLYGSNAFFGVINLVTRDHETMRGPHATATVDEDNTLRGRVGASVGDEDLGGWISVSAATSQGRTYDFPEFATVRSGNTVSDDTDGYLASTVHGKAWAGDLTAQAFYNGREKSIPTGAFDTILDDPRSASNDYRAFGEVRYEPELGDKAQLLSRVYVDHYEYRGRFPYGPHYVFGDFWNGTWVGVEPRLVASPSDALNLTVGAETRQHFHAELFSWEFKELAGALPNLADPPPGTTYGRQPILDEQPTFAVYSGYAIAEIIAADVARLSAGGRFDLYQTPEAVGDNFTTFNPRLALILKPGDTDVVKLMGGTAFRAPSPYEYLYNDSGQTQVPAGNLDPETIATGELEWVHSFDDVTTLTGAAFLNQITSLVSTRTLPDSDLFQYANVGDQVRTGGLEAELRRDWRQGWMAALQHSAQRSRVGDLFGDRELANSPEHLTSLKAAAPVVAGLTTVSTVLRNESPRLREDGERTGWAHIVDATVTGDLPTVSVTYAVGVRNALNWRYGYPGGADVRVPQLPQPGRSLFASFTVQL